MYSAEGMIMISITQVSLISYIQPIIEFNCSAVLVIIVQFIPQTAFISNNSMNIPYGQAMLCFPVSRECESAKFGLLLTATKRVGE